MKKIILFLTSVFLTQVIIAQDIAIGEWKEHLSYKNAISVSEGNGKVFCATKSEVFILNKSDNSMDRLSKVNGLSDVETSVLNFNTYNNKLLIAYKNSNIDILDNGTVTNIGDIKRKPIIGNKSINNIYFINQYAYLSCGFGIVVIDLAKLEVSDTYYIGPNGNPLNVRDITADGSFIYAATDGGVYRASLSNPNLANFTAWSKMNALPDGIYNTIAAFNGKIYTNLSKKIMTNLNGKDTAYIFNNNSWTYFPQTLGYYIKSFHSNNNRLVEVDDSQIWLYDTSLTALSNLYSYFGEGPYNANCAVVDDENHLWIADSKYGLVKSMNWAANFSYYPNGPASSDVSAMCIAGNDLWVAPGGVNSGYYNLYIFDGVYSYTNGNWTTHKGNYPSIVNLDTIYDFINVLVDPKSAGRAYAASWGRGVVEFYNGLPVKHYNESNSSLQTLNLPGYKPIWTSGLAMDASNNLWVANSGVTNSISKKNASGVWQSLDFSPILGNAPNLGQILVDKNDQKWVVLTRGGGLMVYKGGTMSPPSSSNTKKFTQAVGNGALPSTAVYCLAEDLNGEIWVGTDKGIAVFYSPENVFSGQNFDAQQILLEQDGHVQILLETELIQSIAVDDANRKWIATANSGVFLMSADGTKQIYHFDESNSPLFSNDVKSVVINHETGEVYFGTSKGILSYRGTATKGLDDFTDVYAFPNPVKPDYDGPIAIKGMMNNTTLKITDISGTLVYETKSEGGQALWYGKNFKGEKVSTGVYMVFCTSEDGSKKTATKILFIN